MKIFRKIILVSLTTLTLINLTSCSSSLSRKDACTQVAKLIAEFYNSPASVGDSARALALGLEVISLDADEELGENLTIYAEMMRKGANAKTNQEFLALVEPKHEYALTGIKVKCSAEGIKIN